MKSQLRCPPPLHTRTHMHAARAQTHAVHTHMHAVPAAARAWGCSSKRVCGAAQGVACSKGSSSSRDPRTCHLDPGDVRVDNGPIDRIEPASATTTPAIAEAETGAEAGGHVH